MTELTSQQAEALGLPPGGPSAEHAGELSPDQAHAIGLPPAGPDSPPPPREGIRGKIDELLAQPDPFGTGETIGSAAGRAVNLASGLRMPEIPGVAKAAGWLGNKIGPAAESLVQKFTNAIGDKSASAAEGIAKSAKGAYGKAVSEGSRTLERLGMNEGLDAAGQAANQAALETPEAKELAAKLAGKAREALPEQLGNIESAKALSEQTAADASAARSPQAVNDYAAEMRKTAIKNLATRYLAPGAAGALGGWALGGDEHGGIGATGGLALGLLHRPAMGFAMRQIVKSPAFGLPLARAALSTSEKLANMARAGAPELGRFGPILQKALGEGQQSFAASSYALAQSDPDFQHLQQQLAEAK